MKSILSLVVAVSLLLAAACRADDTSGATPWPQAERGSCTMVKWTSMSVTATPSTTTIPRSKYITLRIVSGASCCFNEQGGTVTASAGGAKVTTGMLLDVDPCTTTKVSAVVAEGSAATLLIGSHY